MNFQEPIGGLVERIARALERLAPPLPREASFDQAEGFIWQPEAEAFMPVPDVNRVPISLLKGIDQMREALLANTLRFAEGLPANNALLWGARGMGKSSLVKAVHAEACRALRGSERQGRLKLVEVHREDIGSLPRALHHLREAKDKSFLLFCDDLSFEAADTSYKSLKAVLEGGIEGRPANVLFYATSNRRHLMPREMLENERSTAINPSEAVEEKVSLSDRFGLWIGFHHCSQEEFLEMVRAYARHYRLHAADADLTREALAWARSRGDGSGRVAWQFIQDLAGRLGVRPEGAGNDD
jgi:predicted AAA+ superfamily ATPase